MGNEIETYPGRIDIKNCEKEPIHIIGKIQSHGMLIVCDARTLKITQASANTSEKISIEFDQLRGRSLAVLIGKRIEELHRRIQGGKALFAEEVRIQEKNFMMMPYLSDEHLLLDFEPIEKKHDPVRFQRQLTHILNDLQDAENSIELCRKAAALSREIFGYDRVMIYRFDEEWNGEVIAEEKQREAESWLGLHYPASDIPSQSRALFLKHRVRIISNVYDNPVPVIPQVSPVNNKPLDLSRSNLRGVSPVHIEYLQNMGVGASLTAAIVVNGKLWGLLACHHNASKLVDYYQRETSRFLTQMLSNELALRETNSFIHRTGISGKLREQLVEQMVQEKDLIESLIRRQVRRNIAKEYSPSFPD